MSSSHVVVLDSTARRAVVKVTPGKHLSDVLQEAASKLGVDASQYGLKNNGKQVDLSRTFRLAGLSSGAKLELVLLSRSASVVSVALQLPELEDQNGSSNRLVDKFPSTTTLWLILRKFESGAAGAGSTGVTRNFTARGIPRMDSQKGAGNGAGRLCYETPVLHVMGRDLSSFTDLQKTLGQLGLNGGSALIRLNFKATDQPLEEAMGEIDRYFKSVDGSVNEGVHSGPVGQAKSTPPFAATENENPGDITADDVPQEPESTPIGTTQSHATPDTQPSPQITTTAAPQPSPLLPSNAMVGPDHRPITVYAPPTNTTPSAALRSHNSADYVPSLAHVQTHQSRLQTQTRNTRLLSDAELASQSPYSSTNSSTSTVEIKLRYPDQTSLITTFTATDTASTLHAFVRSTLEDESVGFMLSYAAAKGMAVVPDAVEKRLVADLNMAGRVLVNVNYRVDMTASVGYKSAAEAVAASKEEMGVRLPSLKLKEQFRRQAREMEVRYVGEGVEDEEEAAEGKAKEGLKLGSAAGAKEGKKGVPKWLKLPGRK